VTPDSPDSLSVARRLALLFVAAALVAGTADAYARPHDDGAPAGSSYRIAAMPTLQGQVLAAINDLRQTNGLSELRLNPALSVAALGHSQSMAQHGFFSHSGFDGVPFWSRIKPRYRPVPGSFWSVGENLLWASPRVSAEQAIQMWLGSAPHRKNLLGPAWREVGLGAVHALGAPGVYGGLDVTILTADFGVR
jgi:uncharacterized protein YkwD